MTRPNRAVVLALAGLAIADAALAHAEPTKPRSVRGLPVPAPTAKPAAPNPTPLPYPNAAKTTTPAPAPSASACQSNCAATSSAAKKLSESNSAPIQNIR